MSDERPDNAVLVGPFIVECPDCQEQISMPIYAWVRQTAEDQWETVTDADTDPLWEHSLLTHPEVH